jgi:hypothetical protein
MAEPSTAIDRKAILTLRRQVRFQDGRPYDARCSKVAAAIEAQFGWKRQFGRLRLLDARVCWQHCWNQLADGHILDATADQFESRWSLPDDIIDYAARALRVRALLGESMTSGQLDELLTMYEWAHAAAARGGLWMSSEYAAVLE